MGEQAPLRNTTFRGPSACHPAAAAAVAATWDPLVLAGDLTVWGLDSMCFTFSPPQQEPRW